jgi:hypothetical protein
MRAVRENRQLGAQNHPSDQGGPVRERSERTGDAVRKVTPPTEEDS